LGADVGFLFVVATAFIVSSVMLGPLWTIPIFAALFLIGRWNAKREMAEETRKYFELEAQRRNPPRSLDE
jgi:hypothetical protein